MFLKLPQRMITILWALAAAATLTLTLSLVKTLQHTSPFIVTFSRFAITLTAISPFVLYNYKTAFKLQRPGLQILAAVLRCLAIMCTYHAYAHLPLAFATSIGFTGPLFSVVLAILLLKEKVSWEKWIALIIGYMGVILMLAPQDTTIHLAVGFSLLANIFASLTLITLKKLTSSESQLTIMFYTNIISLAITGSIICITCETIDPQDIPVLIGVGLAATLSQVCNLKAIKSGEISLISPFEYTRLIFAMPIGYMLFSELPDPMDLVGSLFIIGASVMLAYSEVIRNRLPKFLRPQTRPSD